MLFHVLCILPYPGLKYAIDQLSKEFKGIHFHSIVGDLADGEKVASGALSVHNYDLIISRGGTAELLKRKFHLPVIDIGVSQYDILKTLQAASKLNKVAVIGFDSITSGTHTVIKDFQLDIPIFTIKDDTELPFLLKQLKRQQFDAILCDAVTSRMGNAIGLNTLLITSSDESIRAAINVARQLLDAQSNTVREKKTLLDLLDYEKQALIILDQKGKIARTYNIPVNSELYEASIIQAKHLINTKQKSVDFKSGGSKYRLMRLAVKKEEHCLILSRIKYPSIVYSARDKMKEDLFNQEENFLEFFADSDQDVLLQSAKTLAMNQKPTFILGEEGTGKSFLASYIFSKSDLAQTNSFTVDMNRIRSEVFNQLFDDIDSPLFESNTCIFFKNIEHLTYEQQKRLLKFIDESAMPKRNQVIVTFETDKNAVLSDTAFQLISEVFSILSLPTLRSMFSQSLIQLVTSSLNRFSSLYNKRVIGVTDLVLDQIISQDWPRNYRQFIKVLYTSYTSTEESYIDNEQFQFGLVQEREQFKLLTQANIYKKTLVDVDNYIAIAYKENLNQSIKEIAEHNLKKNYGNRKKTAEELGISRTTLWRYLNE